MTELIRIFPNMQFVFQAIKDDDIEQVKKNCVNPSPLWYYTLVMYAIQEKKFTMLSYLLPLRDHKYILYEALSNKVDDDDVLRYLLYEGIYDNEATLNAAIKRNKYYICEYILKAGNRRLLETAMNNKSCALTIMQDKELRFIIIESVISDTICSLLFTSYARFIFKYLNKYIFNKDCIYITLKYSLLESSHHHDIDTAKLLLSCKSMGVRCIAKNDNVVIKELTKSVDLFLALNYYPMIQKNR